MKISIIVPAYNVEMYIERCVTSILQQTMKELELIVVNDGSEDNTREICERIAMDDNRLIIVNQRNQGVSIARNAGIKCANGDYVMFVDSDDYLEKDCLEKCVNVAQRTSGDVIIFNLRQVFQDGSAREYRQKWQTMKIFENEDISGLIKIMFTGDSEQVLALSGPCCKVIRRDVIGDIRFPQNISLGEDTCYVVQVLSKAQKIIWIDEVLYNVVVRKESLSHWINDEYAIRMAQYINWIINYYNQQGDIPDYIYEFIYIKERTVWLVYMSNANYNFTKCRNLIEEYQNSIHYIYHFEQLHFHNCKDKIMAKLICSKKYFLMYLACYVHSYL